MLFGSPNSGMAITTSKRATSASPRIAPRVFQRGHCSSFSIHLDRFIHHNRPGPELKRKTFVFGFCESLGLKI
jgi:hypothetical protein